MDRSALVPAPGARQQDGVVPARTAPRASLVPARMATRASLMPARTAPRTYLVPARMAPRASSAGPHGSLVRV